MDRVVVPNLTEEISIFERDFFKECAQSKPGNIVIAPFSVASSLALLSQGTNGNAFEELIKVLNLSGDKETDANHFSQYYDLLHKSVGESTLSIVNQLYVQEGYTFNSQFNDVAVNKFGLGIETLNFAEATQCAQTINKFIEETTYDKFKDLVNPEMFYEDTRLFLVYAIYFKGNWEHEFDKNHTTKGDFYINESDTVQIDFMNAKKIFKYGVLDELDATALEMKYAKSNISFVIVLPNSRTGLSALESIWENSDLAKIREKMLSQDVDVAIPKFKIEFEINVKDTLEMLGIGDVFSPEVDSSELWESLNPQLMFWPDVVHKSFIQITEEGSEASVATWLEGQVSSACVSSDRPKTFQADHPFVFFVVTNDSSIIFTGHYIK